MREATYGEGDEEEQRERYRELLEELRTIIPGVQVLFAFLVTVPFSSRFTELDQLGRWAFTIALVTVGLAAVVLLTPAAYHRIAPRKDRRQRIKLGARITVAGMALLACGIAASIFVVGRLIFTTTLEGATPPASTASIFVVGRLIFTTTLEGSSPPASTESIATEIAIGIAAVVVGTAVGLWFVLPLLRRERLPEDEGPRQG